MKNYLTALDNVTIELLKAGNEAALTSYGMKEIVPAGLCPLLYHNLIPYVLTLSNNGWFRWIRRSGAGEERRTPEDALFTSSSVNSAFPNEVLVQCPNHLASVVVGVSVNGSGATKSIALRVLRVKGLCHAGHAKGDELKVRPDAIAVSPEAFNTIFPAVLECAVDGRSSFKCKSPTGADVYVIRAAGARSALIDVCAALRHDSVDAVEILGPCRYHAKPAKGIKAGPAGLCPDAHHAIYPYGLARMYGAAFGNGVGSDVSVNCPGAANEVVFRIRRTATLPRLLGALRTIAAQAFGRIFHPVDLMEYRVSYIVERVVGKCPAVHVEGDRFEFNVKRREELCPASFHALYPYIFLKKRGQVFDWAGSGEGVGVPCPDCMGAVYEL